MPTLDVRVPLGAEEWAENIFERYFELVGKIARKVVFGAPLLDRDMYDARLPDSPYWASGLTLEDIPHLVEDEDYGTIDDSLKFWRNYTGLLVSIEGL